ncbi:hypothetical protein AR689_15555 [Arthrobacter sp. EpRS71]|nr:hypothetical protein AR689_15555 [Arthrobacter sp. EpRS71]
MAFLCLFDCLCGRRDQQNDPAPSVVLLPPYLPGPFVADDHTQVFQAHGKNHHVGLRLHDEGRGIQEDSAAAFRLLFHR